MFPIHRRSFKKYVISEHIVYPLTQTPSADLRIRHRYLWVIVHQDATWYWHIAKESIALDDLWMTACQKLIVRDDGHLFRHALRPLVTFNATHCSDCTESESDLAHAAILDGNLFRLLSSEVA